MLYNLLVAPALIAIIFGILCWDARVGLTAGALTLCVEIAGIAYFFAAVLSR
ncbi:MAG: hypothetical protein JO230_28670 [Xanthobacteraceae bacterium]|nr:hypothetical protein [Xanthobacteraceae bacterium]